MVISDTKLAVVEFAMPISEASERSEFWLPDAIKDSKVKVEHIALWMKWAKPSDHLATFIAFISQEDANFMLLKYPEMKEDTHVWPPKLTDKIFISFDK